ncbi:GspH/FimT family protein [Aquipseudomonas alcaligenes]|uniref:GspH/FimT family protein n=2 Tax=Aquipseudomonas alcaligenes TaxID=43263 RepID=UPI0035B42ABC
MKKHIGNSLAELLVLVSLISLLATIALPAWASLVRREQQRADVNQLLSAIHYARSQAVQSQQFVTLCSGRQRCTGSQLWQTSILAFVDGDRDGDYDEDETLLQNFSLSPGVSWQWSSFRQKSYLQFEGNGTTRALNGTFSLCSSGKVERQIVISLTGRPRINHQDAIDCNQ